MNPAAAALLARSGGDDPAGWTGLAPELHVTDPALWAACEPIAFPPPLLALLRGMILREGYFQLDPLDWGLPTGAMAAAIRQMVSIGLPAVFAFHYDEFWLLYRRLGALIGAILGEDYLVLPDFWAWHVDPARDESGWKPHRDKGRRALREDGTPKSLNLWVPLTDATPLNGCMYIVPADRDQAYNTADEDSFRFALPDIRALPARANSLLGWNAAVLHWGAHAARRNLPPRISLALEFQRRDAAPFREPLLEPGAMPALPARQALIGRQVLQYRHMYPLSPELATWAERVRGDTGPAA